MKMFKKGVAVLVMVSMLVFMGGCAKEEKTPEPEYTLNTPGKVQNFASDITFLVTGDVEKKKDSSRFEEKYQDAVFTEIQKQAYDRTVKMVVLHNEMIDTMNSLLQKGLVEKLDELIYESNQLEGDLVLIEEEAEQMFGEDKNESDEE